MVRVYGLQSTVDLDDGLQVLAGAYAPAMGDMVDSLRYGRQIRFLLEDLETVIQIDCRL